MGSDWDLDNVVKGALSSTYLAGMFLGSYFWGYMADSRGRMWCFKKTIILKMIAAAGLMLSVDYIMMLVFLLVLGFFVSGDLIVGGAAFKEYLPPSKSWVYTLISGAMALGGAISGLIALILSVSGDLYFSMWRSICLISIVIELFYWIIRLPMKETPKFLIT